MERLSERQRAALVLVVEGLTNAEIAEALGVSVTAVRSRLNHVYAELGLDDPRPGTDSKRVLAAVAWVREEER